MFLDEHFVIRDCTDKPEPTFCMPGMEGNMQYEMCVITCFDKSCNDQPIDESFNPANMIL